VKNYSQVKRMGKLRVGTTKLWGKMMTWWDSAFQFERTVITSFLCLGRAKPHSSGEWLPRQTALQHVLRWSNQLLALTICACLASSLRKSKIWATEVSRCANVVIKSDGLCSEPQQPLFSARFHESSYSDQVLSS